MSRLPVPFAELEEFVDYWDVPTSHERWMRRSDADYAQTKRFYEVMTPRMEAAAAYVEQYPLHAMPEDAACLFRLLLALMQASIAVELHQAARVPQSPWPHTLKMAASFQPFG